MKRYIYLAGGITGLTWEEANLWRSDVARKLLPIIGISPLRTEPLIGDRYDAEKQAADKKYGTPNAITAKNFLDVSKADAILAYLPHPSTGTFIELGWASAQQKPIVVVTEHKSLVTHPVLLGVADWVLPTLDDAVEVLRGTFDHYAE